MATFYSNENNGIVAVISEEDARLLEVVTDAGGNAILAGVRIFTFYTPSEHSKEFRDNYKIYTGTMELLGLLGTVHEIKSNEGADSGWNGFVPFSNGFDVVDRQERQYQTTVEDVIKKFNLQLPYTAKTTRQIRGY